MYYGWMFWFNWILIAAVVVGAIIMLIAQNNFKRKAKRYAAIPNNTRRTGAEVAMEMLQKNGIHNVRVVTSSQPDHYNARKGILNLSQNVYSSASIYAAAVAAHETGHAIQWAKHYRPARIRDRMVEPVNMVSKIGWMVLFIGLILGMFMLFTPTGYTNWIKYTTFVAIVVIGATGLFQLITLPVEFDASRRAKRQLSEMGLINSHAEEKMVKDTLSAASFTYVAAFMSTMLVLMVWVLRILAISR